MKKTKILVFLVMCLFLTACSKSNIGVIGGADEPTRVMVEKKKDNVEQAVDIEKYFKNNYVNEYSLPILDIYIENPYVSDDRILVLDDAIENNLELMIYEYYHAKISGEYSKIKDVIADDTLIIAIENEEKQFNEGIYFNKIVIDEIDILDKEDAHEISKKNKQRIIDKLDELGMTEFAIIEVEKTVNLNEKYLSMGPQIGNGDVTRYYLLGKKDDKYKIVEVYWEGFIND